jgi:hypothetical protein
VSLEYPVRIYHANVLTASSPLDNVDYNELKNLIKVHTTKDQGQAITIPGQADTALAKFEDLFLNELHNQHDRVDLFVKSKADEIGRRLRASPVTIKPPQSLIQARIPPKVCPSITSTVYIQQWEANEPKEAGEVCEIRWSDSKVDQVLEEGDRMC